MAERKGVQRVDQLSGIADVAEHLLYEAVGLLIPGALLLFAGAAALGHGAWAAILELSSQHPWLTVGGAYALGYPLQGISRPVTNVSRLPFRFACWALCRAASLFGEDAKRDLVEWARRTRRYLHSSHRPTPDDDWAQRREKSEPDLSAFLARYWSKRLSLSEGVEPSPTQVINLSFSRILSERRQLDRFRAAASFARATAATIVLVLVTLAVQIITGMRPSSSMLLLTISGLALTAYGLLERADFYASLWRSVLKAQAVAKLTEDNALPVGEGDDAG